MAENNTLNDQRLARLLFTVIEGGAGGRVSGGQPVGSLFDRMGMKSVQSKQSSVKKILESHGIKTMEFGGKLYARNEYATRSGELGSNLVLAPLTVRDAYLWLGY